MNADADAAAFKSAAHTLILDAGIDNSLFDFVPLSGGANNQVYRLDFPHREPLILKRYFFSPADQRDRFHSEKSFYDFLAAADLLQQTPSQLAWDRDNRLGLFTCIEGRRLQPEEVTESSVNEALGLYLGINSRRDRPEAAAMPEASEACFDFRQHLDRIEQRVARLDKMATGPGVADDAAAFVANELRPAFAARREAALAGASEALFAPETRCLSPSDFGFHNALLPADGRLRFFDFEYAGWDSPSKFLCDFLCQPALPVPRPLWGHVLHTLCRDVPGGADRERVARLLQLYQLKWCCIMLNEFLPREQDRRKFSRQLAPAEIEQRQREQLTKAQALLASRAEPDFIRRLAAE